MIYLGDENEESFIDYGSYPNDTSCDWIPIQIPEYWSIPI